MKRVSFKVAKAIKEAGYPQDIQEIYTENGEYTTSLIKYSNTFAAPTYLEVWLWLWREKNIHIEIIGSNITTQCYATINNEKDTILFNSPEEAIIAAIEYIVEHKLLK